MVKRRIFISFDHDDTPQALGFMGLRNIIDNFDFYNHKLDRRINSPNEDYVRRVILEEYIKPASVTVVLIGNNTARSKWVNWEIEESKRLGKGILGIRLKDTWGDTPAGIPQNRGRPHGGGDVSLGARPTRRRLASASHQQRQSQGADSPGFGGLAAGEDAGGSLASAASH